MTKLFLAVGVAALAIAAPVAAERGGKGGGDKGQAAKVQGGGGKADRGPSNGGGGAKAFRAENRGGGAKAFRAENRGGDKAQLRAERRGGGKAEMRADRRDAGRKAFKMDRRDGDQFRSAKVERKQMRDQNRVDRRELNIVNRDLRGRDVERVDPLTRPDVSARRYQFIELIFWTPVTAGCQSLH